MVARFALLCVVEIVVLVLLALQVFATGAAPGDGPQPIDQTAGRQHANPPREPGDLQSGRARSSPAGAAEDTDPPTRHEVAAKWNPDDPVGVLLTGRIRLRNGTPADASVTASRGGERKYTRSDDGTYVLLGLEPGEWKLTLRGDAIVQAERTVTIANAAVQSRDFTLDPTFPVRVMIVTPDDKDATRALRLTMRGWSDFSVAGQSAPFPERLGPTDYGVVRVGDARWHGEMNPKDGFAGTLHLVSVPAHVALLQRHLVLQQQAVEPGQSELKFVVDMAALKKLAGSATVRILDADTGAPLTDAHISLGTSNRGGGGKKVDEQGRATVTGLSPGYLLCRIAARDHENYFHTVRVKAGQRIDLGEIRLGRQQPLTGTVLMPDGKPAGARLRWTELKWRSSPAEFSHNRIARTEADGSFSLWGTGRGTIAVQARGKDGLLAAGVFDNPPATPVVLRLEKPCECTVTRPADPTRTYTLTLFDGQKRPIAARSLEPRHAKSKLSMPAGDYTFEVHDDNDRLVQTGSLRFTDTPTTLRIR